jgi:glutamate-5-semialdehyde dehydrogenase
MNSIDNLIESMGKKALAASENLRAVTSQTKNQALLNIAKNIDNNRDIILQENNKDLSNGKKNGLDDALIDRLMLNNERIDSIIESLEQIIALPDPIGEITDLRYRPSGIQVGKMRVPIGVIAIIYESRPNVTIDATALCLKSGNAVILRGGSEAINSNIALYKCVEQGLVQAKLVKDTVQIVEITDRKVVSALANADKYIDTIIPRGGKALIETVVNNAKVTVIKHLHGVCHTYIDEFADTKKAIDIAFNGKARRYGVCNATETLLVHKAAANRILPDLIDKFLKKEVELRGCDKTIKFSQQIIKATEEDWSTEYLSAILSIKIVDSIDDAISHIDKYGSNHTESIISDNYTRLREFMMKVDSSSVMINASTAFADGFEYGLGAEIGISTDKFHARGPVGLEGLTSQKYVVFGDGHIRD